MKVDMPLKQRNQIKQKSLLPDIKPFLCLRFDNPGLYLVGVFSVLFIVAENGIDNPGLNPE